MYVLCHENRPDVIVKTFEEVEEYLLKRVGNMAYQYIDVDGVLYAGRKYFNFEDQIMFHDIGCWECPDEYLTYKLPNQCVICKHSKFMQGTFCLFCDGVCDDCGQFIIKCYCPYSDY
jgi:hypothetical protein